MVVHSYDDYGRRMATFDNRLPEISCSPTFILIMDVPNFIFFDDKDREVYLALLDEYARR